MYKEMFAKRLSQLRLKKDVSARDMSLSIGQNPGYINNIECCKALPSMNAFFYICEYLEVTPKDFFDIDNANPQDLDVLIGYLRKLDDRQLDNITSIVKDMTNNK